MSEDSNDLIITCMKCGGTVSGSDAKAQMQNYGMPLFCKCKSIGIRWLQGSEMQYRLIGSDKILELRERIKDVISD